jgi:hypothetical protein
MIVVPLEIKLQCTFGTVDTTTNSVIKKDGFNVDIQKLDAELFRQAFESLEKIRLEILNNVNNPVPVSDSNNNS